MAFPPDYRPRDPPPAPQGKPLLNLSDQEQLDGFFAGFDSNNLSSNNVPASAPGMLPGDALASNEQPLTPQYFISSHTHMQGQPPFIDPNALEGGESIFNAGHMGSNVPMGTNGLPYNQMIQHTAQALPFANYQAPHSNGHNFFDPLAPSISTPYPVAWPHPLPSNNINHPVPRPLVRFGSDSHFQPTGYIPPPGPSEPVDQNALNRFEWLEGDAHSSAPNTQPNTQPSSPVWTRKRKPDGEPPGNACDPNGLTPKHAEPADEEEMSPETATTSTRKRRKVNLKTESDTPFPTPTQPNSSSSITSPPKPTTRGKRKSLSSPFPNTQQQQQQQQPLSTSKPTPSPSSTTTPTRSKRPPASAPSTSTGARVPLTSDQKRANHTNSEQRRRDQAQRAFARLFDLVPELEQEGKLSQMKKLERVVRKIRELEEGNRECRRRIEGLKDGGK